MRRIVPVAIGAAAATATVVVGVANANSSYFETAAQVIPVLLLALAFEARTFSSTPRVGVTKFATGIEVTRVLLEIGLVGLLVAGEILSMRGTRLVNGETQNALIPTMAIVSGSCVVAMLAMFGKRVPGLNTSITIKKPLPAKNTVLLEIGIGNIFGDEPLDLGVNFLIPSDKVEMLRADADGTAKKNSNKKFLTTSESLPGQDSGSTYFNKILPVSAGSSHILHFSVTSDRAIPVRLKVYNARLPGGGGVQEATIDVPNAKVIN